MLVPATTGGIIPMYPLPQCLTFLLIIFLLPPQLGSLFQKSSLGPFYSACRLISLKPEKDGATTSVDVVCTYHPDPVSHRLDIEQLYWELSQLTHDVTQLGFYTLVKDSLFINGECLC